ncbi:MAG TPA: restriction endonuclease [Streptosporangiaceae bacterium]|jgi:putative restriction endonuclease|nr:restriction endonuclease [Streptosporangiaceae bacterium]
MEWLERIARLQRDTAAGDRDPAHALLLLHALGRLHKYGAQPIRFREVEMPLGRLLTEYGPPRPARPGAAFYRLAGGLWDVTAADGSAAPGPDEEALRASDAVGRLAPAFAKELLTDPPLLGQVVRALLDLNFEPSLHAELCAATGVRTDFAHPAAGPGPDQMMAGRQVLVAYACRCAFCGYEGWLGTTVVGVESARLRWRAFDGTDDLTNCLCLCVLHHRLLDRGVVGLTPGGMILVSRHFVGATPTARDQVLALAGRLAIAPQRGFPAPDGRNLDWHARQVFRGPTRPAL